MKKGHLDVKQLESYKKADLQALARELGVSDEKASLRKRKRRQQSRQPKTRQQRQRER